MSTEQRPRLTSGIPRLSRLPVPSETFRESVSATNSRKSFTSVVGSRSSNAYGKSQQKRNINHITPRTESTSFNWVNNASTSESKVSGQRKSPTVLQTLCSDVPATPEDVAHYAVPAYETDGKPTEVMPDPAGLPPETPKVKRKPRPSLSDRTIETLSQIPPSPASNRRKSGVFDAGTNSPMRPPLRPASAMSNSRPRPSSPTKRPPVPPLPTSLPAKSNNGPTPNKHSVDQLTESTTGPPVCRTPKCTSNLPKVGLGPARDREPFKPTFAARQIKAPQAIPSSSTPLPKQPPTTRQPAATTFSKTSTAYEKLPSMTTSKTISASSSQSRMSSSQSLRSCSTEADINVEAPSKTFPQSSAALRDAIAKAKQEVARVKAPTGRALPNKNPFPDVGWGLCSVDDTLNSVGTAGLLRKRIQAGLLSGHLNVAAMGFQSIPNEIKQMYDVSESPSVGWSECVDLTKLIAADNKLENLEDDIFPDATDSELEDADSAHYNGQLRGLETLDLHNNVLKVLPLGLRRLQKLHSLNVSGNKLDENALSIICQIGDSLTELRMSENELSGMLPNDIKNLPHLQVLDLHSNKISGLPTGLRNLLQLKILNLAKNRILSIPSEVLANLTLVEFIASGNRLSGTLFPPQIQLTTKSLKLLDVSYNALEAIAVTAVTLPNVQTVNLTGNRLKTFPDISSWNELLNLSAAKNEISEVPAGLVKLKKLRNADLSNNNITKLDDGIASMEDLTTINLAGNPLRERKYLTMSTDDLKIDLQKRCLAPDSLLKTDMGVSNLEPTTRGILDWSSRSLSEPDLATEGLDGPVYNLRLQHNSFDAIPISLLSHTLISETLKSLELSYNTLRPPYLSSSLHFPQLKDLSLASCHLKELDSITSNLSAPKLSTLNISKNLLSGPLPQLRTNFPNLTILLAADNQFNLLKVSAVQGLTTLDVRNNEIDHLEPRLGLLGMEGGLNSLEVSGNEFRVPRWDVLNKGTEAVLRYLRGRVPVEELENASTKTGVDAKI